MSRQCPLSARERHHLDSSPPSKATVAAAEAGGRSRQDVFSGALRSRCVARPDELITWNGRCDGGFAPPRPPRGAKPAQRPKPNSPYSASRRALSFTTCPRPSSMPLTMARFAAEVQGSRAIAPGADPNAPRKRHARRPRPARARRPRSSRRWRQPNYCLRPQKTTCASPTA